MEKREYLRIEDLRTDDPKHEVWGCVGMDISTGERIFLVNRSKEPLFDSLGESNWRPIILSEKDDEYSNYFLSRTSLQFLGPRGVSKKTVDEIEKSINIHLEYNKRKILPTEFLEENRSKYSVSGLLEEDLNLPEPVSSVYSPTNITFYLRYKSLNLLTPILNKKAKQSIQHEVGHMKTSNLSITESDYLLIKSGFRNLVIKQARQNIIGVGELLVCDEEVDLQEEEGMLGELANEAELIEMDSKYVLSYPDLGRRLDRLTDGAFILSRYNGGLDYFVESLLRVISDEKRAKKLLKAVIESVQSREQPEIDEAIKHIEEYEKAKSIK